MKLFKTLLAAGVMVYAMATLSACTSCMRENPSSSSSTSSSSSSSSSSMTSSSSSDTSAPDTSSGDSDETSGPEDSDATGTSDTDDTDSASSSDETSGSETTAGDETSSGSGSDSSSAAAMSTDFSQIGALDGKKLGWGPGTQRDARMRPTGATAYQEKFGKYNAHFIAPDTNNIYLTFDEGYETEQRYTEKLLDTLKEKNVPAVFFITYDYAKRNPDLVQRMIDEGHIVGNHSYTHPSMPDVPLEQARDEIMKLHDYVKENFHYEMNLFRFPMGEFNEQTLALCQSLGYKPVFWSFAYRDWETDKQNGYDAAYNKVIDCAHPGAIYLLHAVSKDNSEILPAVIDTLREKGYNLVKYDVDYSPSGSADPE